MPMSLVPDGPALCSPTDSAVRHHIVTTNAIFDHVMRWDAIPWFTRFREQRRAYMAQRPADGQRRRWRRPDAPSRF